MNIDLQKLSFICRHPLHSLRRALQYKKSIKGLRRVESNPHEKFAKVATLSPVVSTNRSFFTLAWSLAQNGFIVEIPDAIGVILGLGQYDRRILDLPSLRLFTSKARATKSSLCLVTPGVGVLQPHCFDISFDYYSEKIDSSQAFLPFGMHPEACLLGFDNPDACKDHHAGATRSIAVFCAGNLSYPEYDNEQLSLRFGILTRRHLIQQMHADFFELIISKPESVVSGAYKSGAIAIIDQAISGLTMAEYFAALAKSDFVLCPPGVNHPHCHNIYEGMSRGCIPILEYSHWMRPRLDDGINCIAFSGLEGLRNAVNLALRMSDAEKENLRRGVTQYWDRYVRPDAFLLSLTSSNGRTICMLNETASTDFISPAETKLP